MSSRGGRGVDRGSDSDGVVKGSTPVVGNRVRRGFYLDSVALMRLSAALEARAGVETASLMIGTPSNLVLLDEAGLLTGEGRAAGPNDLILTVRAAGGEALAGALEAAEASLDGAAGGPEGGRTAERLPTMNAACEALPDANLAIVSVPGPFAAREARHALARGLNVLVFSDNVPVEDEVALKREARVRGRLVMGPDCGTAIIAGTPLAFANRVRRGAVGVIAASGTGLQEFSVLVHRGGGGLSHGIGVGGRDLGDEVGGLGTLMALEALEADPATGHVVILSKPPGPRTEAALLARIADCSKPVTLYLVGRDDAQLPANASLALTLRDAARLALGASGSGKDGGTAGGTSNGEGVVLLRGQTRGIPRGQAGGIPDSRANGVPGSRTGGIPGGEADRASQVRAADRAPAPREPFPSSGAGRIVGLFSGGTLCAEGQAILLRAGLDVGSNAPIPGAARLAPSRGRSDPSGTPDQPPPPEPVKGAVGNAPAAAASLHSEAAAAASGHVFLDLGADEYTRGRPHPMIEPAMRIGPLAAALADPTVGVVVLDVVLGLGSHPDPAAPIAAALGAASPDHPAVVASVCGTELDPQGYAAQRHTLESAGVLVAGSNADAVEAAIRIAAAPPRDGGR